MKEGNKWLEDSSRSSLRVLGTVGEPIKEPEWKWYFQIGRSKCPIVDTLWQTETGGIMISPYQVQHQQNLDQLHYHFLV